MRDFDREERGNDPEEPRTFSWGLQPPFYHVPEPVLPWSSERRALAPESPGGNVAVQGLESRKGDNTGLPHNTGWQRDSSVFPGTSSCWCSRGAAQGSLERSLEKALL